MRSIIIDAAARTVIEKETDGDLKFLQQHVGGSQTITVGGVRAEESDVGDTLFVDDEGLLHGEQSFFLLPLFSTQPLAGNGVIVGSDEDGETVGCLSTLAEIQANIRWLTKSEITDETWMQIATTTLITPDGDGGVVATVLNTIDRHLGETASGDDAGPADTSADSGSSSSDC